MYSWFWFSSNNMMLVHVFGYRFFIDFLTSLMTSFTFELLMSLARGAIFLNHVTDYFRAWRHFRRPFCCHRTDCTVSGRHLGLWRHIRHLEWWHHFRPPSWIMTSFPPSWIMTSFPIAAILDYDVISDRHFVVTCCHNYNLRLLWCIYTCLLYTSPSPRD